MKIVNVVKIANAAMNAQPENAAAVSSMKTKDCACTKNTNPSHQKELSRLNRISGQLEGVKKMIEDCRYCPEILIQLKAVRSAIKSVESNILKTHLEHCVAHSFENEHERDQKIKEIKDLLDRFQS